MQVTVNNIIDQYIAHLSSQESNLSRKSVAAEVRTTALAEDLILAY